MSMQLAGLIVGLAIFAGYLGLAYYFSKPGSYEKARDFKQMGIGRGSYRGNDPLQTPLKEPEEPEEPPST